MTVGEAPVRGGVGKDSPVQASLQGVFRDAARTVSLRVGDGCLIRTPDSDGDLCAVAAHHLSPVANGVLSALLSGAPLSAPAGWVGQALDRGCVLRLPETSPRAAVEAGLPLDWPISDAIVIPITGAAGVIVALRDAGHPRFSFADRLALERIAAETAVQIEAESPTLDRPRLEVPGGAGTKPAEHALHGDLVRLLDKTTAGLWLVDDAGLTAWVNEAASELVGVPASELVGARIPEFVAGADGTLGADLHADRRSDRKLTRPDGSELWLSASARPLFDDRGKPAGTLLTLFEIEERKRREVDLRMRLQAKEALVDLAEISLDAPDLVAILSQSASMLVEQADARLVSVSTVDLERRELRVLAAVAPEDGAWADELVDSGPIRLPEQSLALAAVEHGSPVVVDDFNLHGNYPTLAEHGIRSGAFVSLGDGRSLISALSRETAAFGTSAVALIESVGRMIANYQALLSQLQLRNCGEHSPMGGARESVSPGCDLDGRARAHRLRRRPGA